MVRIDADTTSEPGVVRLYAQGQLDLDATSSFAEALACAARLRRPIEINLAKIDFIDGSGLSMLMDARSGALRTGRRLTIVDVSRCVRRLIKITDTADRLPPLPPDPHSRPVGAGKGEAPEVVSTPTFRT
jgi:anti-anti-sigma factor